LKVFSTPHQEFLMRAFSDDFLQQYSLGFLASVPAISITPTSRPLARSGAFTLKEGTAISLTPNRHAVLRVATGRIWATLGSPAVDHVVRAGESLNVRPGDVLVIESWPEREAQGITGVEPAGQSYFDWIQKQ
jgi:hypothetical protein